MEPIRACPICPNCGGKKFVRLQDSQVKVKCISCNKITEL